MKRNFAASLERVLKHEGGYVDHPKDPGGATNFGITRGVLAAWRGISPVSSLPKSEVKNIKMLEVEAIYKAKYWDVVNGDQLPSGVDFVLFDFAVNSGPSRAAKFVQRIVGVTVDGKIGPATIAAINKHDPSDLITKICNDRLIWLRKLGTFKTFGKGWTRRVNSVLASGKAMTLNPAPTPPQRPKTQSGGLISKLIALVIQILSTFGKNKP